MHTNTSTFTPLLLVDSSQISGLAVATSMYAISFWHVEQPFPPGLSYLSCLPRRQEEGVTNLSECKYQGRRSHCLFERDSNQDSDVSKLAKGQFVKESRQGIPGMKKA